MHLLSISTFICCGAEVGEVEGVHRVQTPKLLPPLLSLKSKFCHGRSCLAMAVVSTSRLALANGSIPLVGYGCWKVDKANAADLVEKAIRMGYRHIDGACDYGNEKEVILKGGSFCPGGAGNQASHRRGSLQTGGALCHLKAVEHFPCPRACGGGLPEEP